MIRSSACVAADDIAVQCVRIAIREVVVLSDSCSISIRSPCQRCFHHMKCMFIVLLVSILIILLLF